MPATTLPRIAAVVDVRGGNLFSDLQEIVQALRDGANVRVVFLEATDAALVRRFEQVRRPHPLQGDGTLLDGIAAERSRMAELREASDIIIDTSDLNIHQLATIITERFAEARPPRAAASRCMSFGFKYGLPTDADLVADARFLPNPFWVPELRHLTGEDAEVARLRARPAGRRRIHRRLREGARAGARRVSAREQATRDDRHRMHRRQAPLRRDRATSSPTCSRSCPASP